MNVGDLVRHTGDGDVGLVMGPLNLPSDTWDGPFETAANWVMVLWDDGTLTPQYVEGLERVEGGS